MLWGAVWLGMAGEASSVLVRCGTLRLGSDRQGSRGKARSGMVGSGMARFGLAVVVGNVGVWWRGVRYGMAVEA